MLSRPAPSKEFIYDMQHFINDNRWTFSVTCRLLNYRYDTDFRTDEIKLMYNHYRISKKSPYFRE